MNGRAYGSVWDALEDDPATKAMLKLKSLMLLQLKTMIERKNLKQHEVAELCGVSQSKISYVVNGQISKLSIYVLTQMFSKLGHEVEFDFELKDAEHQVAALERERRLRNQNLRQPRD